MTDDPTPTSPKFSLPPITGQSPQAKVDETVAALNAAAVKVATGSVPAVESVKDAGRAGAARAPKPGRHLSTQTEYPARTAVFAGAVTVVSFLAAISSILADERVQAFVNAYVPGQAAGVIGFGVFLGVLVSLLHRVANIPAVAALRTRLGFGPVPKNHE